MASFGSLPFTATTASERTYTGLKDAICNNPVIDWLMKQNPFVLLILLTILMITILTFRYYYVNLDLYREQFQFVFKGEKNLMIKETISDSEIKIKATNANEFTTMFWLYVEPPSEDFATNTNRIIFMRGDIIGPSIVFYIDQEFNTLKCSLKVQNSMDETLVENAEQFKQLKYNMEPLCKNYLTLEYPQIPVQRWVQVAVVVSQYTAHLYIDNYSVDNRDTSKVLYGCSEDRSVEEIQNEPTVGSKLLSGQTGDIRINPLQEATIPQKGYIKGLQLFNRAITERKIQNIYRQNPNTPSELKYQFNRVFNLD